MQRADLPISSLVARGARGHARQGRGFTLIELMVAIAIGGIAMTAIGFTFISQAQIYQRHEATRGAQSSARRALSFLEDKVRRAGYGVTPDRAILAFDSFNPATPTVQGDNFPDAFVLHYRDPMYRRVILAAEAAKLTLGASAGIRPGQVLLAVCRGGSNFAFVTAGTLAPGDTVIPLSAAGPAQEAPNLAAGPLFRQQATLATPCFSAGDAELYKVDRYAFYLDSFDEGGPRRTPYLMLHRGLDEDGSGTVDGADAIPFARDIEQLQVAYILNTQDNSPPPILGVNDATPPFGQAWLTNPGGGPELSTPYTDASRFVSHPANIRQVRLSVVARAASSDPEFAGDDLFNPNPNDADAFLTGAPLSNGVVPWRRLENLAVCDGAAAGAVFCPRGGGFRRHVLRMAVAPKNLLMRAQFMTPNLGGG